MRKLYKVVLGITITAGVLSGIIVPFGQYRHSRTDAGPLEIVCLCITLAGIVFIIAYNIAASRKKALTSEKHRAKLEKQVQERPEPPFLRPAGCSTYMAGRMKALYPDGEVLENGSFILRFKGGCSAAYYAPRVSEAGVWPSLEKYYYQCCDYCGDKAHKQCDRCGREQELYITLKNYFDSIIEERRVHVLGTNIYGEETVNQVCDVKPGESGRLMTALLYGGRGRTTSWGQRVFISPMAAAVMPGELKCAYAEMRSYRGTYDRVMKTQNRGGPVLEYTPWVWPETEESEQLDSEKGH